MRITLQWHWWHWCYPFALDSNVWEVHDPPDLLIMCCNSWRFVWSQVECNSQFCTECFCSYLFWIKHTSSAIQKRETELFWISKRNCRFAMPGAAKGAWGRKYPLHGLTTKASQEECGSSVHWSAIRFGVTKIQSDNKEETIPFQWYWSGRELVRVSLKRLLMSLNFATNTGRAYFSFNWNCFNIVFLASKYETTNRIGWMFHWLYI